MQEGFDLSTLFFDTGIVYVFHGATSPWTPFRVDFTPQKSLAELPTEPTLQRDFLNEIAASARQAVFRDIGQGSSFKCFSCDAESMAVFVLSSHQANTAGDDGWTPRTFAATRCLSEDCLNVVQKRLISWLTNALEPGQKIHDHGINRGCFKCCTEKRCIELGFKGDRVCWACRTYVCHNCAKLAVQKDAFKCCGVCRVTAYCGKDCQRAHWGKGHKVDCPTFKTRNQ